jgi:acetolactate synthase-1/3 small subunit
LIKKKHLSRITIVTKGTPEVIKQIKLQLGKLIPVHKVADFSRNDPKILFKELALLKIVGATKKLDKAKKLCKKHNGIILDKTKKSFVIQGNCIKKRH